MQMRHALYAGSSTIIILQLKEAHVVCLLFGTLVPVSLEEAALRSNNLLMEAARWVQRGRELGEFFASFAILKELLGAVSERNTLEIVLSAVGLLCRAIREETQRAPYVDTLLG